MKQPIDYTMRTTQLSNRVRYANKIVQQALQEAGTGSPFVSSFPLKEASSIVQLRMGEVATTPAEVARYLSTIPSSGGGGGTPASVPSAPTALSTTAGNEHISISFTQGSDGGAAITNYEYLIDPNGAFVPLSPAQTTSPVIITGLTNGVAYTIQLRAVNSVGAGPASDAVSETPTGTDTFTAFTAVETTSWTAPTYTTSVTYLIVGGGGGSGGGFDTGGGGGGGAGEVVTGTFSVVGGTTYTVAVGDGGAAGVSIRSPVSETSGGAGDSSSFASITAAGGSGGFGSRNQTDGSGSGGAQVVAGSGGGAGRGGGATGGGGGGGGNGGAGGSKSGATGGAGGAGVSNSITGSAVTYGAGGAGATGGTTNAGVAGTNNRGNGARGGGGGAGAQMNGAKGGTGYVALRYNQ